jgi:hypothetical protein
MTYVRRIVFAVTEGQLADLVAIRDDDAQEWQLPRVRYLRLIRKGLAGPGEFSGQIRLTLLGAAVALHLCGSAGPARPVCRNPEPEGDLW